MIDRALLIAAAAQVGVTVPPETAEKFDLYARRLTEWNEKVNLTAITEPDAIVLKHFVDSLSLLPFLPDEPFSLVDVGTGAGFPSVPLALLRGDMRLTLLDSLQKRLTFLESLCAELGLSPALVHARAEDAGHDPALREQFDVATARAVAATPTLAELCLPFTRPGGQWIALKGPSGEAELLVAEAAIDKLGGRVAQTKSLTLPGTETVPAETRLLIFVDKVRPCAPAYPRPAAKIAKKPL